MSPRYHKPAREIILEILGEERRPMRIREIVERTGVKYNTVRVCLQDLKKEGFVEAMLDGWIC